MGGVLACKWLIRAFTKIYLPFLNQACFCRCYNMTYFISFFRYKKKILILFFLYFYPILNYSQSTHSNLKDKADLKKFKRVSQSLVCQCGCKMLLDSCNHFTCLAWSMRSIIDELILAGYTNQFILDGFQSGFPVNMISAHKAFDILKEKQYEDYIPVYANGFGPSVLSKPQNKQSLIFIALASLGIFLSIFIFIYRRKKPVPTKLKKELSAQEKKLYQELYSD